MEVESSDKWEVGAHGSLEAKRRRPNSRIHRYLLVHGHCMQTHGHSKRWRPNAPNATSHIHRYPLRLALSANLFTHGHCTRFSKICTRQFYNISINTFFTFWWGPPTALATAPICKLLDPSWYYLSHLNLWISEKKFAARFWAAITFQV